MILREVITKLGYNVDESNLKRYQSQVKTLAGNINTVARGMQRAGVAATLALSAPIGLMMKKAGDAASEGQEIRSKYAQVFKDMRGESEKMADQFAADFDVAGKTARKLLGDTGDLLTGFGYSQEEAAKLSDRVNRLAGDLTSFQNVQGGVSEASQRLLSGMVGNVEALRSMGIVIRQDTPDFKKRVDDLVASTGMTIAAAKAQVILNEAYLQSKNAVGDYERTRMEHANRERAWMELRQDLYESFGEIFLPILTKGLDIMIKAGKWMLNMDRNTKKVILAMGVLLGVVGPLVTAFGTLLGIVGSIVGGLGGAGLAGALSALSPLILPVIVLMAKLALIAGLVLLAFDDIYGWTQGKESITGLLLGDYETFIGKWKQYMTDAIDAIVNHTQFSADQWSSIWKETFAETIKSIFTGPFKFFLDIFAKQQGTTGDKILGDFNKKFIEPFMGTETTTKADIQYVEERRARTAEVRRQAAQSAADHAFKYGDTTVVNHINIKGTADPVETAKAATKEIAKAFNNVADQAGVASPSIQGAQ